MISVFKSLMLLLLSLIPGSLLLISGYMVFKKIRGKQMEIFVKTPDEVIVEETISQLEDGQVLVTNLVEKHGLRRGDVTKILNKFGVVPVGRLKNGRPGCPPKVYNEDQANEAILKHFKEELEEKIES